MRSRFLIVLVSSVALAGCSAKKLAYVLAARPGAPVSDLVDRSDDDLAEIAVRDLMGEGNRVDERRSDPREGAKQVAQPKWGWTDQLYLAEKIYTPLTVDHRRDPRHRKVQLAWCEWQIQSGEVEWTKTPGEALDAGLCRSNVGGDAVLQEPLLRYALAQVILEGHPRREKILDELRWQIAQVLGGKVTRLCFDDNGHVPALVKVDDGCYAGTWQPASRHDGYSKVRTHIYSESKLEDRTPRQLAQTSAVLLTLSASSPHKSKVPQLLSRISSVQTWKAAEKVWPLKDDGYMKIENLEKAISVLQKLPKDSHLYVDAQARIKLGQQKIKDIKAEIARQEKERKLAEARAAEEERRFIASLGPGQKQVFNQFGHPDSQEPAPGGGKIWRYEQPIYSNLRDHWGSSIIIGYRWREYSFDVAGNMRKRSSGGL